MSTALPVKVLVVDDQAANRIALKLLLSTLQVEVVEAQNGNEALTRITEAQFALLLLDVDMPGMDGYEVAKMVKQVESTRDIPVVFMTAAFSDELHELMAYRSGGIDYIEKPINDDILLAKVRVFVELFEQKQKLTQTVAALQESEARFRGLVDHLPGIIYRSRVDQHWTMLFISDAVEKISGYPASDFVENRVRSYASIIHPQDVQMVEQAVMAGVAKGIPFETEYRILDCQGQVRWVYEKGQGIGVENGQAKYRDGTIFDNSERMMAKQELLKFQSAVEQSPVSVVITNLDGDIQYVNPWFCQVTGYNQQEVLGKNPRLLKSQQTDPHTYQSLWATITSGQVWQHELLNCKKDGTLYWEWATISPLRTDPKGPVTHYIGIKDDISERKKMEDALQDVRLQAEAASLAKTNFLANMSHEIRTPMNAILGMGELLGETTLTEKQAWYVTILNRSGKSLLTLINDILDLSKIEAGQLELEYTAFNLPTLLHEIMDLFQYSALDKKILLHLEGDAKRINWVKSDPTRLRQVLLNLLGNAIKFTKAGGKVTIHIKTGSNNTVTFSVIDTGIGISQEMQEEIFKPFTQADTSTTRKHGGTGLGLTICRRIVDLLNGELHLVSKEGHGSTFAFSIPLARLNQAITPTQHYGEETGLLEGDVPTTAADLTLSILLVEDAAENQMVIQCLLQQTLCTVDVAENGYEAVQKYTKSRYDVLLMDIQMPVMDGYRATKEIRAWEEVTNHKKTPIIALTAHAMRADAEKIKAAGCNLHLTKPIRKAKLFQVLQKFQVLADRTTSQEMVVLPPDETLTTVAQPMQGEETTMADPINMEIFEQFRQDFDDDISNILHMLLQNFPTYLQAVFEAIKQNDPEALIKTAHKLKGSVSIFGADNLAAMALRLEMMGRLDQVPDDQSPSDQKLLTDIRVESESVRKKILEIMET